MAAEDTPPLAGNLASTPPDGTVSPEGPGPPQGFVPMTQTSPYGRLVGPVYEKTTSAGRVFGFRVNDKHVNLGGVAHGGMLATFADIVLGQFAARDFDKVTVTVRMVTDFLAPARPGDWVEGTANLTRQTKSFFFVDGVVTCRSRNLLNASAIFKVVNRRRG